MWKFVIMMYWILKFYAKKYSYISAGILAGVFCTSRHIITKGNWVPFWFLIAFLFGSWCIFRFIVFLDTWNNTSQRMKRARKRQKIREELEQYLSKQVSKSINKW